MNDELWDRVHRATFAAHQAHERLDDAWATYRALTSSLHEARQKAHRATDQKKRRSAHHRCYALIPEIEAQMHVLQQAMIDVETAETARRQVFEAAVRQPAE